ncbi:MAG: hydroxymethylbilane synthase [Taibaiella sp.]|nr:hydroxymethylbilane synthase [Taibaiella sp.]
MIHKVIRIGTRESQLAVWQATTVQLLLAGVGYQSELVYIKSDGDTDLKTPLYEIGVQGIFTKALDIALLKGEIDIAVHSMKDVPTILAKGIAQAAVLPRASYKDLLVRGSGYTEEQGMPRTIATSSIRRKAQWLNRYPGDRLENLRGNVNTRLRKVAESNWHGAIFAAAGLERIGLRPADAISLDWMLPAPAQGAIVVVCRENDMERLEACRQFNDEETAICTKIERDFLRALMGGCSTPISALAETEGGRVVLRGSVLSVDGVEKIEIHKEISISDSADFGTIAGKELLNNGGAELVEKLNKG